MVNFIFFIAHYVYGSIGKKIKCTTDGKDNRDEMCVCVFSNRMK